MATTHPYHDSSLGRLGPLSTWTVIAFACGLGSLGCLVIGHSLVGLMAAILGEFFAFWGLKPSRLRAPERVEELKSGPISWAGVALNLIAFIAAVCLLYFRPQWPGY